MGKLSRRVPTTAGATGKEQRDSCRSPFPVSRGTIYGGPVEGAQAFYAGSFVRPALQSTALCFLIIMISMITMVKPAQATGTVPPQATNYCVTFSYLGGFIRKTCSTSYSAACSKEYGGALFYSIACGHICVTNTFTCSRPAYVVGQSFGTTSSCPASSTGTPVINPTSCTCNTDFAPDSSGTSCVPVPAPVPVPVSTCPVLALTAPPFNDACAEVLENIHSTQAQKDAACGALSDALKDGIACFTKKLASDFSSIPLKITSNIRSVAYQAHFRDIWDKMEKLVKLMKNDPAMQITCADRRAEIAAEKGCDNAGPCTSRCYDESATQRSHCLIGRPANPNPNDAQHTSGNAFDVSRNRTINPLQAALGARNPPQTIPQFLDAPPTNCNLNWGGTFTDNYDPIHFYAR